MNLFGRDDPSIILAAPSFEPYTSPALITNLVFRVVLGIIANLICLVPLRLLYRHGEFAAVVFILNVEVKNLLAVINALIWSDDNMAEWWPGHGFCDANYFIHNFSLGLYATCLLAIIRNLAHQVGMLRANPLTVKEKRQRNIIQALIMFPFPIIQLGFTWFLTAQRYAIGTLIGCSWVGYGSWPYLVFFVLAPVVVALLTAGYAVLMYSRFREVSKSTQSALSNNRVACLRAQRTRRRLYLMVVAIMVPFLPIVLVLCVLNIKDMGSVRPFDYDAIHNHAEPFPWNSIIYLPSSLIDFSTLNNAYISILTAIPIFVFFGMTKDAMNDYRRVLVFFGVGKVFPSLLQEYDPDRQAYADVSLGSNFSRTQPGSVTSKSKVFTTFQQLKSFSTSRRSSATQGSVAPQRSHHRSDCLDDGAHQVQRPQPAVHSIHDNTSLALPHRNPFLFRTRLDFSFPFRLPFLDFGTHFNRKRSSANQLDPNTTQLQPVQSKPSIWQPPADPAGIHTRVWSDEEAHLCGAREDDSNRHSIGSGRGVIVETMIVRETDDVDGDLRR